MKSLGQRGIYIPMLIFSIFVVFSCSKDDAKNTSQSSVHISTNFIDTESAGIPGGIARFTIKLSNAENFDYLEFHKKTNGIEDGSAYIKLTKFDVTYTGNNEFQEIIEYVLKNEDVGKDHEVVINVYDNDGLAQSFSFSFLVAPQFPSLYCSSGLTTGVPYKENQSATVVKIEFRMLAGFGEINATKTINGSFDNSFNVIINEETIIPLGNNDFKFSFVHNFVEEEVGKEVKYSFHLIDALGREKNCEVVLTTLPPRSTEVSVLFTHNPWDIESGYILYSISENKLYRLIDVENDPDLESKIDIVFNLGLSLSSPSVSNYTVDWTTRNITTFKNTIYYFWDLSRYNAYEIYSFYDESTDSPSFYASNSQYGQAMAFKATGVDGGDPIQGMFYISDSDPGYYAKTGIFVGRKPLD